jgi:hypothetical protein
LQEGALAEQVAAAVASEAKFRKDDDLGPFGRSLLERLDHQQSIGRRVA